LLGAVVNWAVSSLAYEPRFFSPWSGRHPRDGTFSWKDRLPLFGWWRLRRRSSTLGSGFWVRPLFVELGMSVACATLYVWEVLDGGLLPPSPVPYRVDQSPILEVLHGSYLAHVLVLAFMLAASLIDFDELNIPDAVTVPGTFVGLVWMTFVPMSLAALPGEVDGLGRIWPVHAVFPFRQAWVMQAAPNLSSLAAATACYWLWCGGLLYRPWKTGRGYGVAVRLLFVRTLRDRWTPWIALTALLGSIVITAVWLYEPLRWVGLVTSLVGVAAGGAVVWITRICGRWGLQQEAMGFGDVTLMSMIGAFVGWQAAVMIFFTAPATALVFGGIKWLITRDNAFCYGPFLCLAAVGIVTGWSSVWHWARPRFEAQDGLLIPAVLVVGFFFLWLTLAGLRLARTRRG
jgi:prepilin signal peptidase PulO-like enzyme (type II secretory pathway)